MSIREDLEKRRRFEQEYGRAYDSFEDEDVLEREETLTPQPPSADSMQINFGTGKLLPLHS